MAPRSRLSLQHVFIPPKIRAYFDLKVGDLLKSDVMKNRIVIHVTDPQMNSGSSGGCWRFFKFFSILISVSLIQAKIRLHNTQNN